MVHDSVLEELRKACDDRAGHAGDLDAVGGKVGRYVATPVSTGEVSELMRVAARRDLCVAVRGSGTKLGWGGPPTALHLIIDTTMLSGIIEHAAGDLVLLARSGTRYDDLQVALGEANQRLALDSCLAGATLGGIIASNASGPRRLLFGTMRDLLIGVTFVRVDGVVAKSGGKVVKNVAGYDFGKLLTGSFGTLAVLTEVALRLHPTPGAVAYVRAELPTPDDAGRAISAVLTSQVVPTAVEIDQPPWGPIAVTVLLEGTVRGVEDRVRTTAKLLGGAGASAGPPDGFATYPFEASGFGVKLTSTLSGTPGLLAAARSTGARHGVAVHLRGSAAGVLHAGVEARANADMAAVVSELRSAAESSGGRAVVLTMPPDFEDEVDRWGRVDGLELMRRVKDEFDPQHRLAPGRFVGGI